MSEAYTPTTDEIRERASRSRAYPAFPSPTLEDDFDRWLAEHDRQVAERAWDEGYTRGNAHNGRRDDCPYRAAKG